MVPPAEQRWSFRFNAASEDNDEADLAAMQTDINAPIRRPGTGLSIPQGSAVAAGASTQQTRSPQARTAATTPTESEFARRAHDHAARRTIEQQQPQHLAEATRPDTGTDTSQSPQHGLSTFKQFDAENTTKRELATTVGVTEKSPAELPHEPVEGSLPSDECPRAQTTRRHTHFTRHTDRRGDA